MQGEVQTAGGGSSSFQSLPLSLRSEFGSYLGGTDRRKFRRLSKENLLVYSSSRPRIIYEISERRTFTSNFPPTQIKTSGPYRVSSMRFDPKPDAEKLSAIFHLLPPFNILFRQQSEAFLMNLELDRLRPLIREGSPLGPLNQEEFVMLAIACQNLYYNILTDVSRNGADGTFRSTQHERKSLILFSVREMQESLVRVTRDSFTVTKTLKSNWIDLLSRAPGTAAYDKNSIDALLTRLPNYATFHLQGEQLDDVKRILSLRFRNPVGEFDFDLFKQNFDFTVKNEFMILKQVNPRALTLESALSELDYT